MHPGAITQYLDVAELALAAFGLFFAGLIFHLHLENKREGYPMVEEPSGKLSEGFGGMPSPKTFLLHDGSKRSFPNGGHDPFPVNGTRARPYEGDPLVPNGDPMLSAFGPGAYAMRADVPDMTFHGEIKIVPMRVAKGFYIPGEDRHPVGMQVIAGDGKLAGKVSDVWVDRAEVMLRYIEVALSNGGKNVLLPMTFASFAGDKINVQSIFAHQFANVPALKNPEQITFLEEEKIVAYYGGGKLYASPERAEPFI